LIKVVKGDITQLRVDVIVTAVNLELDPEEGASSAIHAAGGPGLLAETRLSVGQVIYGDVLTSEPYGLNCQFVVHTLVPSRGLNGNDDDDIEILADCYRNSIRLAYSKGARSIVFPSLGTEGHSIPVEYAAGVVAQALVEATSHQAENFDITLCVKSDEDYDAYSEETESAIAEEEFRLNPPACPICFHPLKRIVYGLMDVSGMSDDIYMGGCTPCAANFGCNNCDWTGEEPGLLREEKELVWIVFDESNHHFKCSVGLVSSRSASFFVKPAGTEESLRGPEAFQFIEGAVAKCKEPTFWWGYKTDLLPDALRSIQLEDPYLTEGILDFVGFAPAKEMALLQR
jgi:O-acetyl-ADP-ribose deacetylase (regulator of RNase III)